MTTTRTNISHYSRVATLLLFLFLAMTANTFAQQGQFNNTTAEDRAKRITSLMKSELKLTATQETKVQAINLKYAKLMDQTRKLTDNALRMKTMAENDKAKDAELKTVLTADQFKAYEKYKEEMKARRRK